ncbi:hAT family dimerization domain-containing protein [Aspergillus affinis]|uniref:hAT family dimerization domain-containing protein n=1 Tax=Aspergillus affinis TaxID=1070780 RepID=UPI0022FE8BA6|nr:uncharacterized protein KD926_009034 [Aspergillus affinis]KAI9039816.1 hypothetical protein KD926_009034 [Aspergillus affinis]
MNQLKRKRVLWKQQMLESLKACRQKLDEYYSQTDRIRGHIYAIGTMLAPDSRFQFFLSEERLSSGQDSQNLQAQTKPSSWLNKMLNGNKISEKPVGDEVTQYLDSDLVDTEPLQFWRDNQSRFPAIALLARDILSIPATGAGVERLFNTARNVYHYRRSRLKSETVKEIMLFLCVTRFDLKDTEAKQLEQLFTLEEIELVREQNHENLEEIEIEIEIDIISDEEEEEVEEVSPGLINMDSEPQLPETTTQLRVSRRKRKSRADDDFEQYWMNIIKFE